MEIKVTIALDEKAHDVLNRLITALSHTTVRPTKAYKDDMEDWSEEEINEVMEAEVAAYAEIAEKADVSRTNAEIEEVAEPKPKKARKPVSDSVDASKKASPKVTIEDLRALAADVKTKTGNIGKVKALLSEYSAKNISALPADKWDEFAERLKELL